jgi:hypothetical protein
LTLTNSTVQYEPCVVSFIDVLGFRNLLQTRSAAQIEYVLRQLKQFAEPRESKGAPRPKGARVLSRTFAFAVSDAIVRVRAYDTKYHDGAFFSELYDLLHAQMDLLISQLFRLLSLDVLCDSCH